MDFIEVYNDGFGVSYPLNDMTYEEACEYAHKVARLYPKTQGVKISVSKDAVTCTCLHSKGKSNTEIFPR